MFISLKYLLILLIFLPFPSQSNSLFQKIDIKLNNKIVLSDEKNFEKKLYDILDLRSKYVVNFWATWCIPCKEELPDLSLLKSKIKKYNIDVFTISIDKKDIKDQLKFLSNNGASNLDHFFDKEMKIFKALKLRGIPTTIIVDQNSFIISKHEGILKWGEDEIINKIKSLFY